MKYLRKIIQFLGIAGIITIGIQAGAVMSDKDKEGIAKAIEGKDAQRIVYLETKYGTTAIELEPSIAPKTVARIKELVDQGFYNDVPFHRVIEGFMAQTGDPTGTGTGGSGKPIDDEFNSAPHLRGTVSMANSGRKNSQDSQFFIVYETSRFLDEKYTVFGKVIYGMEYIDKIKKGSNKDNGVVNNPDRIVKMYSKKD